MGGHKARRAPWEGVIPKNGQHVSPCYSYRNLNKGESVAEYVTRLKDELDANRRGGGYLEKVQFLNEVGDRRDKLLEESKDKKRRRG